MSKQTQPKRPMVMIITAVFLAYAGLIPLPHMLMADQPVSVFSKLLVGLTLVACVALLLPGRSRLVFHITRVVLACWVVSAVVAFSDLVVNPAGTADPATAGPPPGQVILLVGALAMALLFYFFSFGRASRVYYGLSAVQSPEA